MSDYLSRTYGGNTVEAYVTALVFFLIGLGIAEILVRIVIARLKKLAEKSETTLDDFLVLEIERSSRPLLYFASLYLSTRDLSVPTSLQNVFHIAGIVLLTFFATGFLIDLLTYLLNNAWKGRSDAGREQQVKVVLPIIRIFLWGLAAVFLLDNLGFKVSSILAGLGIGGIAVALAAQAVLGDLLSYIAIVFDKPFVLGDFIVLEGDYMGAVEHIGIKTTQIRSLSGEIIVLGNSDLTSHRVRNYKHMKERRIVLKLGVTYDTPTDKLEAAPGWVKGVIESTEGVRFDRCHFCGFGDSSLDLEAVYFILSPDYNRYMDLQQGINLRLKRLFDEKGVSFAFPTRTVQVVNLTSTQA